MQLNYIYKKTKIFFNKIKNYIQKIIIIKKIYNKFLKIK